MTSPVGASAGGRFRLSAATVRRTGRHVPTRRLPRPGRTRHASVATSPPPRRTGAANPLARPATPVSPPWHLVRAPRHLRHRRTCDFDRRGRIVPCTGSASASWTRLALRPPPRPLLAAPPSGTVPRVPVGVRSPVRGTLSTTHHPRSRGIFEVTGLSTELPSNPQKLAACPPSAHTLFTGVDADVTVPVEWAAHDGHHDHHHHSLAHTATCRRAHQSRPRGGSFISRHETRRA